MPKSIKLPRTVRGKRPAFFETPGLDDAMSMILILAQELAVMRERMDSAERVAARHGFALADEIEALPLDDELLQEREQWRQDYYDRLFYLARQKRSELEQKHSEDSYNQVIDKVARGDI
jgi:hypothetical protein